MYTAIPFTVYACVDHKTLGAHCDWEAFGSWAHVFYACTHIHLFLYVAISDLCGVGPLEDLNIYPSLHTYIISTLTDLGLP